MDCLLFIRRTRLPRSASAACSTVMPTGTVEFLDGHEGVDDYHHKDYSVPFQVRPGRHGRLSLDAPLRPLAVSGDELAEARCLSRYYFCLPDLLVPLPGVKLWP